jgi:hypothetical protein
VSVVERLAAVRARIAHAGGRDVRIVAVTKGFGADAIDAAVAAGCRDIGESYAQELAAKRPEVHGPAPVIHFIGHLQTNKVKQLAPLVDVWQSVDRPAVVEALARHGRPGARVLVQVNIAGAEHQGGCAPTDAPGLVRAAGQAGLEVLGLMAIGRPGPPELTRPGFRHLRHLADDLGLTECSMGMSDDLEVAVEEGSTMVRVGTALFGTRPVALHHQATQAQ